jgi:hypothetical protein
LDISVEAGNYQKQEVSGKTDKPTSDIRFVNDFKRYLNDNSDSISDPKRTVIGSHHREDNNSRVPLSLTENESRSSHITAINMAPKHQYPAQVGKVYATHKETLQATHQIPRMTENKISKEIDKTEFRSQIAFKKPLDQETGLRFSLLGSDKSILAIRSYRSNTEGLINWVTSKFGHSLKAIIVNGQKILTNFGTR